MLLTPAGMVSVKTPAAARREGWLAVTKGGLHVRPWMQMQAIASESTAGDARHQTIASLRRLAREALGSRTMVACNLAATRTGFQVGEGGNGQSLAGNVRKTASIGLRFVSPSPLRQAMYKLRCRAVVCRLSGPQRDPTELRIHRSVAARLSDHLRYQRHEDARKPLRLSERGMGWNR
jgi:hypothetical protein